MGAGRRPSYNPRTGSWTRPRAWYDHSRGRRRKSGCYVATAVYGSYDCPEVWTLRRYRDFCLAKSFWGRIFISIYYAVSPTIVKIFGSANWFTKLFRSRLDSMVKKLNDQGYSSESYQDINW